MTANDERVQKSGDNPNTFSKREAGLFRLLYTYKDLAADSSTLSTKHLPDNQDVAGAPLGIRK